MLRNYINKRTSDFGADQLIPLDRCLYRCVWESANKGDEDNEVEGSEAAPRDENSDKDAKAAEEATPEKDRILLVVNPNPKSHPWIKALKEHLQDLRKVYPQGVFVFQTLEALKKKLVDLADVSVLNGALEHNRFDLMYVCDAVTENSVDMVHMLEETQYWLELVAPKEEGGELLAVPDVRGGPQKSSGSEHLAVFVTFGGNVESSCPGAGMVMGFGRTLQSEHAFDGVKCALVDLEPLPSCPARESFRQYLDQVFLKKAMHDEMELAIRGGEIVLPRMKRFECSRKDGGEGDQKGEDSQESSDRDGVASAVEAQRPSEAASIGAGRGGKDESMVVSRSAPGEGDAHQYENFVMRQGTVGDLHSLQWEACEMPKLSNPRNVIVQVRMRIHRLTFVI